MGRFRSSELLAAVTILSNVSQALSSPLEPTAAKFVRMPIKAANLSKLLERQNFYVPLGNAISTYQLEVSLGSPAQQISFRIDTGSSDIWVYGPGSCSACVGGVCKYIIDATELEADSNLIRRSLAFLFIDRPAKSRKPGHPLC